jgi:putative SOS response-associated peptidase YedK
MDQFFEPSYLSGRAVRTAIRGVAQEPLGVASLWDTWKDPLSDQMITSFSLITINADNHPVMRQFHRPEDEKRTIVCLKPQFFNAWLSATHEEAHQLLQLSAMTQLE